MIKETYIELIKKFDCSEAIAKELWIEIETNYSAANRFYHTLDHLKNLLEQLISVKGRIENWEAILFSVYYHDVIYDSTRSDNEEQSAIFAEERMKRISVPYELIEKCKIQILATKFHNASEDMDNNYFTDADLSILGQAWNEYSNYIKNVRMEYGMYSDSIFNEGRSKVLQHFLNMERIFKTDYFYNNFEEQAKRNINMELAEMIDF